MLKHEYDIQTLLSSIVGYRGLPFPGAVLPKRPEGRYAGDDYDPEDEITEYERQTTTNRGTQLYKQDHRGRWYFMPVIMRHRELGDIEIPNAIISVTGKKNIVETQLVGRKGSVKELINLEDYKVSIAAFIQSADGKYPEDGIMQMRNLFENNEAVELISALTDLIFDEDDNVVITDMDFPAMPGIEDGQVIRIECLTDRPFELTVE